MRTATKSIDLISTHKKKQRNLHMQYTFFVHFLPLLCITKTSNFLLTHYFLWRNFCMCSAKVLLLVFLFTLIFSLPLIFTLLAASISHFLTATMKFSCFSSKEIRLLCFKSLALALSLLST